MSPSATPSSRDPRVDLLRGVSLLSIFVDHIPNNRLADFTLHNFGFSDAAELFVLLAGYSVTMAYGRTFDREGTRTGIARVLARCLKIYGVQTALLLGTLAVVTLWSRVFYGYQPVIVAPMLRDGVKGAVRGVTLRALPTYLDILPLYIVLLAGFPLVRFGIVRSVGGTLLASAALWAAANLGHWNLPNLVDPAAAAQWYFNPFTWQVVFVLGAAFATSVRNRAPLMVRRPPLLGAACWAYLVVAFLAVDAWKLWPAPFGPGFPGTGPPFALFGNEPKSFVTPWRIAHIAALIYLSLTSPGLMAVAHARVVRPVIACGRHSLPVFAAGCMLSLFGRLIFRTVNTSVPTEVLVNAVGLVSLLVLGMVLDGPGTRSARETTVVTVDAGTQARGTGS